jgi:hypothetical protein
LKTREELEALAELIVELIKTYRRHPTEHGRANLIAAMESMKKGLEEAAELERARRA